MENACGSSLAATLPLPDQAVHSATKAAAAPLVESLAVDPGPHGIRVGTLAAGGTRTP